jgi:hypothetical protein
MQPHTAPGEIGNARARICFLGHDLVFTSGVIADPLFRLAVNARLIPFLLGPVITYSSLISILWTVIMIPDVLTSTLVLHKRI